uniref:Ribonuclease A-domain domain-containing protein n=1 Tax=Neogobius melanostomus TaxID=47308 RepID=A0A8C6SGE7_9GOBI
SFQGKTALLLLLLVFLTLVLVLVLTEVRSQNFEDFKLKHIFDGESPDHLDCNTRMRLVIGKFSYVNRDRNTFITNPPRSTVLTDVKNICMNGALKKDNGQYTSTKAFLIVDCILEVNLQTQTVYQNGTPQMKSIKVGCENGFPVHFHG